MSPENDQTRWIGVRPTNPPEIIPTAEQAHPTVYPTRKSTPAITDLQAAEEIIRVDGSIVVAGGNEYYNVYTVPAGKIYQLQNICGCYTSVAGLNIFFYVKVGAVYHYFYVRAYGAAWEWHCQTGIFSVMAGDIVGVRITPVANGQSIYGRTFGYLTDIY